MHTAEVAGVAHLHDEALTTFRQAIVVQPARLDDEQLLRDITFLKDGITFRHLELILLQLLQRQFFMIRQIQIVMQLADKT